MEETKEQKVYRLVTELELEKRRKKDTAKAYNEEIKRISKEIKDLLTNQEEENE